MKRTLDLVGLGDKTGAFANAFEKMAIAEREILRACRAYPKARTRIWNAFGVLVPGGLSGLADAVYRHHCRELLTRVARGEDLRPGTRAEICAMISKMTLVTRLHRDVELFGLIISNEIFPGRDLLVEGVRAEYPDAIDEIEAEFRRKLAKPDRRLREDLRDPPDHFLAECR